MSFSIISTTYQENVANPCDYVDVRVVLSETINSYTVTNQSRVYTDSTDITISFLRDAQIEIEFRLGATAFSLRKSLSVLNTGQPFIFIRKLYQSSLKINSELQLNGTHSVEVWMDWGAQGNTDLPYSVNSFEFSLDGSTWQYNTRFLDVPSGTYTAYLRDSLGCVIQKEFTLSNDSSLVLEREFSISNVNSITFAKDEEWDSLQNGIFKTKDNTLSLTGREQWLSREEVLYRDSDSIRIQFKSNYPKHDIEIEGCTGDIITNNISSLVKSDNMDLFESLDCVLYPFSPNLLGMYFTGGDYYDETGAVIGQFELKGNLPDSAIVGTVMDIPNYGAITVADVFYDASIGKKVCVFNTMPTSVGISVMKALYNLLPYDIYEFDLDFSLVTIPLGLLNQIRVKIRAYDDVNVEEVNYYSEYIKLLSDGDWSDINGDNEVVSFDYYNANNKDIFYIYGITHFFRTSVFKVEETIIDESENTIGDTVTRLTKSSVNEGIKITFGEVNYREMIKIVLALSSEFLFVNKKGYVKNNSVSVKKVENSNLYGIEADLISSGESFNINVNGASSGDGTSVYLTKLVDTEAGNYLKI